MPVITHGVVGKFQDNGVDVKEVLPCKIVLLFVESCDHSLAGHNMVVIGFVRQGIVSRKLSMEIFTYLGQ